MASLASSEHSRIERTIMSVCLHLIFTVRDFDTAKQADIKKAAEQLLFVDTDIGYQTDLKLEFVDYEDYGYHLRGESIQPLIVTRSYQWEPEIRTLWEKVIHEANGVPCTAEFAVYDFDAC